MATTLAIRIQARIIDSMNVEAVSTAYALVDPSASFDAVASQFNTFLVNLDAMTDGQIIAASYTVLPALPDGLKSAPATGSRAEQTGVLNFNAAGDSHLWGFAIPALSNSTDVVVAGRIVLDSGKPANTLYTLLAGGGTAILQWTNATSQALSAFKDALISFRQHNQQLARNTYERA